MEIDANALDERPTFARSRAVAWRDWGCPHQPSSVASSRTACSLG